MPSLNLSAAARYGLNVLALLGVILALHLGKPVFVPFVIAGLVAVLLWPSVRWLNRRVGVPRFLACVASLSGLVVFTGILFLSLAIAVPSLLQGFPSPTNAAAQEEVYNNIRQKLQAASPVGVPESVLPADAERSTLFQYARKSLQSEYVTGFLFDLSGLAMSLVWQSVLILFIALFLLEEGGMFALRIKELFGQTIEAQGRVAGALDEMVQSVRDYMLWRTLINIVLGLALGGIYDLIGLRQAWTWGLLTMLLTYVPYLGTIAAGIPPVLDAFISVSPLSALGVAVMYTAIVTVEGYLIVPVVMGRSMDLNATTVILACLFWDLLWGMTGLFLAMPLMACVKAVCMQVEEWRPWGRLMSTEQGVREAEIRERARELAGRQGPLDADATAVMTVEEEAGAAAPKKPAGSRG